MDPNEAAALKGVAHRLGREFPDRSPEEIAEAIQEAERAYDGRPIRTYIPIFVERDVLATFTAPRQRGQQQGTSSDDSLVPS